MVLGSEKFQQVLRGESGGHRIDQRMKVDTAVREQSLINKHGDGPFDVVHDGKGRHGSGHTGLRGRARSCSMDVGAMAQRLTQLPPPLFNATGVPQRQTHEPRCDARACQLCLAQLA